MTMSLRPDIMEKMAELSAIAHVRDGFLTRRQHDDRDVRFGPERLHVLNGFAQ